MSNTSEEIKSKYETRINELMEKIETMRVEYEESSQKQQVH